MRLIDISNDFKYKSSLTNCRFIRFNFVVHYDHVDLSGSEMVTFRTLESGLN